MKRLGFLLLLSILGVVAAPLGAQNFYAMKNPDCLSNVNGLFTVGGQYVDPNNGVLPNSWSMLVRWQGNAIVQNSVNYDAGVFTGVTVPAPRTTWQRGQQPEYSTGTPAVQMHCNEAGMVINTWTIPHRYIEGGGYNDMFGYSWGTNQRPRAFTHQRWVGTLLFNDPAELVLQADLKTPSAGIWAGTPASNPTTWTQITDPIAGRDYGALQNDLFVYLADTTHPNLKPIAMVIGAYSNLPLDCPANGAGGVSFDYPTGVWYAGTPICTTDIATVRYTGAFSTTTPFSDWRFYRIHVTPANWRNIVTRINQHPNCANPGVGCPAVGYSTNPADYVVNYFGVIGEIAMIHAGQNPPVATDAIDRQVSLAIGMRNVGAFWYAP